MILYGSQILSLTIHEEQWELFWNMSEGGKTPLMDLSEEVLRNKM